MTTSGKITCNTCGGIIDESCDCVILRMNDEARRYRKVGSGRFGGPFVISDEPPMQPPSVCRGGSPDSDPIDSPALWRAFFTIVALVILAAFAALVIVLKP